MASAIRRVYPRVSYEERIRLLGDDGRPLLVGQTLNLSPSGIYVRAPNGCEIGSEVTCDFPLPGGTRQLRGRVTRTQPLPDESTGIGIQFVDLTPGDSSSLHRALEGSGPRPVAVKVLFEGMARPVRCHGVVTAEGLRLNTTLPFLRLGSDVRALYDGHDAQIDARGVLTGVRLEPVGSDGVPRLGVDVELESEMPVGPSSSPFISGLPREDASAGGAFTTWDSRPVAVGTVEPAVVTDPGLAAGEGDEVTAVVHTRSRRKGLPVRFERFPARGFAIVALVAFGVVYVGMKRFPLATRANQGAQAAAPDASGAARANAVGALQPLVVPSGGWPVAAGAGSTGPASVVASPAPGPTQAPASTPAPAPPAAPAPPPALAVVDEAVALAARHPRGRPQTARPRLAGSPFHFAPSSGRHEPRPGASIDMKGEPLIALGGGAASEGAVATDLRGVNVPVESSSLYLEVTLPRPESDGKFAVQVKPSWPTTLAVAGKSTTGFTISFGTPAPADAHLDWVLVR